MPTGYPPLETDGLAFGTLFIIVMVCVSFYVVGGFQTLLG